MRAENIEDIIKNLTEIIEWSRENASRLGYFPALYRKVTVQVRNGIEEGFFEHGDLMDRFDVVFANRYLDAFHQYVDSGTATRSWKLAMDATSSRRPVVLQHLLLGMNAHIALDLAVTVAETTPERKLPELKNDFLKINGILSGLID
jgi:hypothetical protein